MNPSLVFFIIGVIVGVAAVFGVWIILASLYKPKRCRFATVCSNYVPDHSSCRNDVEAYHFCGKYKEFMERSE